MKPHHSLLCLALGLTFAASACRTSESGTDLLDAGNPMDSRDVNASYPVGSRYEMTIDPNRELDQVTVSWDARYALPMRDGAGRPVLNDEGKPMYEDGIYAYGKVQDASGALRDIGPKKFVDANETDNWHDISGIRGRKLVIEFWHARQYSNDPRVLARKASVFLRSVTLRYKDAPGALYKDYVFNPNRDDALAASARAVPAGGTFDLAIPANLRVYRVDVRWGDAKPRVNGVYVAGRATGRLRFNGAWQGDPRNVAAIETQTWASLAYPAPAGANHALSVSFQNDAARVHSVRVYYKP